MVLLKVMQAKISSFLKKLEKTKRRPQSQSMLVITKIQKLAYY